MEKRQDQEPAPTAVGRRPANPTFGYLRSAGAGAVAGVVSAVLAVALAALIFTGDMAVHFRDGVGLALFGASVIAIVVGATSSLRGVIAGVQDNTTAILAVAATAIAASVEPEARFGTTVAVIVVTGLLMGAVMTVLGTLRLGRLVRLLPFPVIAGLLAGTGLLIVVGAAEILTGTAGFGEFIDNAFDEIRLVQWVPGLVLAIALLLGTRRTLPFSVATSISAGALFAIYGWMVASGTSVAEAQTQGLLLGPFPGGALWTPDLVAAIGDADWSAVVGQSGAIGTIVLLVPITLLLYVGALELALSADIDGDRELRVVGFAGLLTALGGGLPGYHYVADTVIAARLAPLRRLTSLAAAGVIVVFMLGGGPVLGLVPTPMLGGVLLFIGVAFILEWTWDARRRLPSGDMVVVVGILLVIAVVGFLPGVAIGIGAAMALFVVRYARVDVVKHALDGRSYRSRVDRSAEEHLALDELGHQIVILDLQAYLFFGTAERLRARVADRLAAPDTTLVCVVLGFRRVTGIDSSALLAFERIAGMADQHGFGVVVADVPSELHRQLHTLMAHPSVEVAPDVDRAVELCEERLLGDVRSAIAGLATQSATGLDGLDGYVEPVLLEAGDRLLTQGEPASGLYLVQSGTVTVILETEGAGSVRLRTMGRGTLVGEVSLYLGTTCTAHVVADSEVTALRLSPAGFERLQAEDPSAAAELNRRIATVLARRLEAADSMLRDLLG